MSAHRRALVDGIRSTAVLGKLAPHPTAAGDTQTVFSLMSATPTTFAEPPPTDDIPPCIRIAMMATTTMIVVRLRDGMSAATASRVEIVPTAASSDEASASAATPAATARTVTGAAMRTLSRPGIVKRATLSLADERPPRRSLPSTTTDDMNKNARTVSMPKDCSRMSLTVVVTVMRLVTTTAVRPVTAISMSIGSGSGSASGRWNHPPTVIVTDKNPMIATLAAKTAARPGEVILLLSRVWPRRLSGASLPPLRLLVSLVLCTVARSAMASDARTRGRATRGSTARLLNGIASAMVTVAWALLSKARPSLNVHAAHRLPIRNGRPSDHAM